MMGSGSRHGPPLAPQPATVPRQDWASVAEGQAHLHPSQCSNASISGGPGSMALPAQMFMMYPPGPGRPAQPLPRQMAFQPAAFGWDTFGGPWDESSMPSSGPGQYADPVPPWSRPPAKGGFKGNKGARGRFGAMSAGGPKGSEGFMPRAEEPAPWDMPQQMKGWCPAASSSSIPQPPPWTFGRQLPEHSTPQPSVPSAQTGAPTGMIPLTQRWANMLPYEDEMQDAPGPRLRHPGAAKGHGKFQGTGCGGPKGGRKPGPFGSGKQGDPEGHHGRRRGKDELYAAFRPGYHAPPWHQHGAAYSNGAQHASMYIDSDAAGLRCQRPGDANCTAKGMQRPNLGIPNLVQLLREMKRRLRHVQAPGGMAGEQRFSKRRARGGRRGCYPKGGGKGRDAAASSSDKEDEVEAHPPRISWVLHEEEKEERGEDDVDQEVDVLDLAKFRAVAVTLESTLVGGEVTVELNGRCSSLRQKRWGRSGRLTSTVQRFDITPLHNGIDQMPEEEEEEEHRRAHPSSDDEDALAPRQHLEAHHLAASSDRHLPEPEPTLPEPEPASFSATVTLEGEEIQAWTTQQLVEPGIVVVEVCDTSVLLRLTDLTGDRFELTVYASGRAADSSKSGSTLVQGLIKSSESLQTVEQLEPSQVYVAWVRVFCADQVQESKQKGFKTKEAKEKTIWDIPDHEILGVERDSTAKEINKAFRQKSLMYHPDKEVDPDKKDAAEDMMKRLNLAKTNMLRCASTDCVSTSEGCGESPSDTPFQAHGHSKSFFTPGSFSDSDYNSDMEERADEDGSLQERTESSRTPKANDKQEDELEAERLPCLRCSLRVEAPRPPKLKVQKRELNSLLVEASGLPLRGLVEVQRLEGSTWIDACPPVQATSSTMILTIMELEEHSCYKLRLKTSLTMEPLRFTFAKFGRRREDKADTGKDEESQLEENDAERQALEEEEQEDEEEEQEEEEIKEQEEDQEGKKGEDEQNAEECAEKTEDTDPES